MIAARNPMAAALPTLGAAPVSAGALAPSPLLVAMVAEWEAVGRRLNDPALDDGPEAEMVGGWHTDLQQAIYLFPASSALDLVVKAPVFRDAERDAIGGLADGIDPKGTLPGAAWFGLMRDFERLAHRRYGEGTVLAIDGSEVLAHLDGLAVDLLRELEECDRQKDALSEKEYDTPRDEELYKRHWDLRERIDELASASPLCLRVKARTALLALKWDPDAENEGSGSYASLAKQIVDKVGGQPPADPAPAPSLVDQILACWREWITAAGPDETDAERETWERITARRDALLDAVEELPATLENLPAKALALAWLQYVAEWKDGQPRDGYAIDGRLVLDIDAAIGGRLRTKA